jgi:c-di-GMP-binding flagellar brake protein YcgR
MTEHKIKNLEPNTYLPISVGTELLVEITDLKLRLKSELIGIEDEEYLLIKLSHHDPDGGFNDDAIAKSPVIIKYAYRGSVYGFKTDILNIVSIPAHLAFVSYPKQIEEHNIRASSRFDCVLPAEGIFDGTSAELIITDISVNGCRCVILTSLIMNRKKLYEVLNMDSTMELELQFPGMKDKLRLPGIIKNINKDSEEIMCGVKFEKVPKKTEKNLENFIKMLESISHSGTGH